MASSSKALRRQPVNRLRRQDHQPSFGQRLHGAMHHVASIFRGLQIDHHRRHIFLAHHHTGYKRAAVSKGTAPFSLTNSLSFQCRQLRTRNRNTLFYRSLRLLVNPKLRRVPKGNPGLITANLRPDRFRQDLLVLLDSQLQCLAGGFHSLRESSGLGVCRSQRA